MADSQKPIKNSLLSAATTSNFFEDAALFVPVPLAESEPPAPATAEIDLNSDDSSPNRGSVEKDFAEQLTFNETVEDKPTAQPQPEEQPVAISLFSRAATSGGDLFSRMLAGSSGSKPVTTPATNQQIQPEVSRPFVPVVPQNGSSKPLRDTEDEEPAVVSLFSAPPTRLNAFTPTASHTDFLSNPAQIVSPQSITEDGTVASTASLFSSTSAFVPTNLGRRPSPSFQPIPPTTSNVAPAMFPPTNFSGPPVFSGNGSTSSPLPTANPSLTSIHNPVTSIPHPQSSMSNPLTSFSHAGSSLANPLTSVPTPMTSFPPTGSSVVNPLTSVPSPMTSFPPTGSSVVNPLPSVPSPLTSFPPTGSSLSNPLTSVPSPMTSFPHTGSSVANPSTAVPSPLTSFPHPGSSLVNPLPAVSHPGSTLANPLTTVPSPLTSIPHPGSSLASTMTTAMPIQAASTPMVPLIPSGVQQNVTEGISAPSVPPTASGNSNAFRLGGQRMKYVACPEMQSAPTQMAPAPQNLPFSPMGAPNPSSAFTPTFTPAPAAPAMGATFSNTTIFSQGTNPGGSPGMMQNAASPTTPSRPPPTTMYASPVSHVPAFGPQELSPLTYHWFYRKDADGKVVWKPFSIIDSVALEDAFSTEPERLVPTDGGRYDICVHKRLKTPVYWEETPIEVRRGSWFFKGPMDNRFIPYDEDFALRLESEYADCMRTGVWQKRLEFPDGESVIMHSAGVVVHFCQAAAPDDWGNLPESQIRPRVVKRGVEEIEVEDGESSQIDHLVFVVHGIGPICDFKLRNIVEAVDDFRGLSFQLLHSHYRESMDRNLVGRVEFLPVSWHKALHGDKGIDEQLKRITLRSIPKFRDFTNDTLLDILFYTSPVYCQTIIDSVSSELNRIYKLFLSRNPSFHGKVSLTGHSLGSLILFDLLAHQPLAESATGSSDVDNPTVDNKEADLITQSSKTEVGTVALAASSSRTVSYTVGTAGTGQPFITYPKIDFAPNAFFALGSPIAMFVTVRGIEKLGNDFRLPTCPAFFNIFHPYDPVAYRIETLIDPDFQNRPVLIPHHKGRKRIHLELKETMARVGADIKHKVIDAVKNTINTVYHYTGFSKTGENLENEIQSAIAGEMERKSEADGAEDENAHIQIGSLNGGRRIDHVLQEAPYETFNEYVFAMSTHVGYWESEDTMLLILTETYGSMGIQRDRQVAGSVTSPTHPVPGGSNAGTPYYSPTTPILSQYESLTYQPMAPSAPPMQTSSLVQTPQSMFNASSNASSPAGLATLSSQPPVPMMQPSSAAPVGVLLPPNPVHGSSPTSAGNKVIGNRPVTDPSNYPRGMDPTAPMLTLSQSQVAPPPKTGFVRKFN